MPATRKKITNDKKVSAGVDDDIIVAVESSSSKQKKKLTPGEDEAAAEAISEFGLLPIIVAKGSNTKMKIYDDASWKKYVTHRRDMIEQESASRDNDEEWADDGENEFCKLKDFLDQSLFRRVDDDEDEGVDDDDDDDNVGKKKDDDDVGTKKNDDTKQLIEQWKKCIHFEVLENHTKTGYDWLVFRLHARSVFYSPFAIPSAIEVDMNCFYNDDYQQDVTIKLLSFHPSKDESNKGQQLITVRIDDPQSCSRKKIPIRKREAKNLNDKKVKQICDHLGIVCDNAKQRYILLRLLLVTAEYGDYPPVSGVYTINKTKLPTKLPSSMKEKYSSGWHMLSWLDYQISVATKFVKPYHDYLEHKVPDSGKHE